MHGVRRQLIVDQADAHGARIEVVFAAVAARGDPTGQRSAGAGATQTAPAQGSPLDTPVSLAQKDRTLDELLRELARSLTQLSPVAVHEPGMLVGSQRFAFSASNEPARSVLARALQADSSAGTRHQQRSMVVADNLRRYCTGEPLADRID